MSFYMWGFSGWSGGSNSQFVPFGVGPLFVPQTFRNRMSVSNWLQKRSCSFKLVTRCSIKPSIWSRVRHNMPGGGISGLRVNNTWSEPLAFCNYVCYKPCSKHVHDIVSLYDACGHVFNIMCVAKGFVYWASGGISSCTLFSLPACNTSFEHISEHGVEHISEHVLQRTCTTREHSCDHGYEHMSDHMLGHMAV